jgi:hypothetical protein
MLINIKFSEHRFYIEDSSYLRPFIRMDFAFEISLNNFNEITYFFNNNFYVTCNINKNNIEYFDISLMTGIKNLLNLTYYIPT